MTDQTARKRLADLMEQRLIDLRLTWREVAAAGEISYEALRAARNGTSGIRPRTQASIEDGLRWRRGSIVRILNGGDPEEAPPLAAVTPLEDRRPRVTPELAEKIQPLVDIAERYVEQAEIRQFGRRLTAEEELDPRYRLTGAQVFGPNSPDALTWDLDLIPGRTNKLAAYLQAAVWQHLADDAAERQRGRASS